MSLNPVLSDVVLVLHDMQYEAKLVNGDQHSMAATARFLGLVPWLAIDLADDDDRRSLAMGGMVSVVVAGCQCRLALLPPRWTTAAAGFHEPLWRVWTELADMRPWGARALSLRRDWAGCPCLRRSLGPRVGRRRRIGLLRAAVCVLCAKQRRPCSCRRIGPSLHTIRLSRVRTVRVSITLIDELMLCWKVDR
jgi:hypothetical protein